MYETLLTVARLKPCLFSGNNALFKLFTRNVCVCVCVNICVKFCIVVIKTQTQTQRMGCRPILYVKRNIDLV